MNNQKQRGIALLTVLLILAVMVIIAGNMSSRLQLDLRRTSNILTFQQARWYAVGAEALVEDVLKQSLEDDDTINLSQNWATEGMVFPVDGGEITGQVYDQQGCFNVNALVGKNDEKGLAPLPVRQFRQLLEELGIESYDAEQMSDAVRDWIDADTDVVTSYGAEDATYESLTPPYQPANQPMKDVSELRAIQGFTRANYLKVEPYVCALPISTLKINANTIPVKQPALLAAVFTGKLSLDVADTILSQRDDSGWESTSDLFQLSGFSGIDMTSEERDTLDITSKYFKAELSTSYGDAKIKLSAYFHAAGKTNVYVTRRQFGGAQ